MVRALFDGERFGRYRLHAFVVMPNRVHLLVTPQVTARQWLGRWFGLFWTESEAGWAGTPEEFEWSSAAAPLKTQSCHAGAPAFEEVS